MQNDKDKDNVNLSTTTNITHEEQVFNINHSKAKLNNRVADEIRNWEGLAVSALFMLPFLIMTTLNVKTALVQIVILALIIFPIGLLRFALVEKLKVPELVGTSLCVVMSMGIITLIAIFLRAFLPEISGAIGRYLYLYAAYPVIYSVFEGKKVNKASALLKKCLRNVVYFAVLMTITSAIREIFGNNQILNIRIPIRIKVSSITLSFFGFILVAFVIALIVKFVAYKAKKKIVNRNDEESA